MKALIFIFPFLVHCKGIEINSFIYDTLSHFGLNSVAFVSNENIEITDLKHHLWFQNIKTSFVSSNSVNVEDPIFVLNENESNLENVKYVHGQTWFISQKNLKYLNSWKLRLDSMIFIWEEISSEEIKIKV